LRAENKTSAQLAEEIGVQPSGISHILSGRNNPSLDFVLKMLEKYPFISTDWFLFGKGTMYKDSQVQSLFGGNELASGNETDSLMSQAETVNTRQTGTNDTKTDTSEIFKLSESVGKSGIVRIIWFFADNSFQEYFPRS
jgi:transcriptional regulator with XRE-family HTH domain